MEPMTMMALGSMAGSLLGGAGSFLGGSSSADDLKDAAKYALMQQREAQAYNTKMYNSASEDVDPYMQGGLGALPYYLNMASGGLLGEAYNIKDSPSYTYQQGKMEDVINQRMASMGISGSRANVNALAEGTQSLAASEYDSQFQRMAGLANMGLSTSQWLGNLGMGAANTNASIAMQGANSYGNYMGQAANAQAAGTQGLFNGLGSGISGFADNMAIAPAFNNLMKTMSGSGGGTGTAYTPNYQMGSLGNFSLGY